jgi:hypothetical protein
MVYEHQREGRDQEFGAWTRYTNHHATGWCNLKDDAFWGSTDGQVFSVRNLGDSSDYRDDASAVDDMVILMGATDFDRPGERKMVDKITAHWQIRRSGISGTELLSGPDLDGTFTSSGTLTVTDNGSLKAATTAFSLQRRRLEYLQVKITNSTKDEDVILSGLDFKVALLNAFGIQQKSEST